MVSPISAARPIAAPEPPAELAPPGSASLALGPQTRPTLLRVADNPAPQLAQPGTAAPASRDEQLQRAIGIAERVTIIIETSNTGGPSKGAGVVIPGGYATTSAHMVEHGRPIFYSAVDAQGQRIIGRATLLGKSPELDIALLRLEHTDLTAGRYSTQPPRLGDPLIVFGSPWGLDSTATLGIVSGVHRTFGTTICDCLQTDAPVNPGNSGGATFNLRGEITGQIVGFYDTAQSIALATTAATLARAVERLKQGDLRLTSPGFEFGDLSLAQAHMSGQRVLDGPVVTTVTASASGIRQGDRVIAVDGTRVGSIAEARTLLALIEPGASYRVTVMRGNQRVELPLIKPR